MSCKVLKFQRLAALFIDENGTLKRPDHRELTVCYPPGMRVAGKFLAANLVGRNCTQRQNARKRGMLKNFFL